MIEPFVGELVEKELKSESLHWRPHAKCLLSIVSDFPKSFGTQTEAEKASMLLQSIGMKLQLIIQEAFGKYLDSAILSLTQTEFFIGCLDILLEIMHNSTKEPNSEELKTNFTVQIPQQYFDSLRKWLLGIVFSKYTLPRRVSKKLAECVGGIGLLCKDKVEFQRNLMIPIMSFNHFEENPQQSILMINGVISALL